MRALQIYRIGLRSQGKMAFYLFSFVIFVSFVVQAF